ncbi:ATP-binding protein [Actinomadura viridis]|uniref:ATP-binding protein n=1 Tax=Actinomadura viridis TaxID=58110 RepID=UPI003681F821
MSAKGLETERRGRHEERVASWDLAAETTSAAAARTLTAEALRRWRVDDREDVDDIVLMVHELVTNAVVHGHGRVRLRLCLHGARHGPRLTAEVGDGNPAAPGPPGPGPEILCWAEGGRGLLLVGALASAFGTRPQGEGKTVWFSRDLRAVNAHPPGGGPPNGRPVTDPAHSSEIPDVPAVPGAAGAPAAAGPLASH